MKRSCHHFKHVYYLFYHTFCQIRHMYTIAVNWNRTYVLAKYLAAIWEIIDDD